jgi:MFS family permease
MNRAAFYALLLAMLTTSLGVGLIVPLLPIYASNLGAGGIWIGLIFGANPLVRGLFTLVVGGLADRREKKGLMTYGLLGYAAVSLAFLYSRTPLHLFLARMAQGAFSAMIMPVARAYAGELAPKGREGTVMGQFALAFTVGFALGPLMGGLLSDNYGMAAPFLGMTALSMLAWVFVHRYVPARYPTAEGLARRGGLDFRPLKDSQVVGLIAGRTLGELGRGIFTALMPMYGSQVLMLSGSQTGLIVTMRSGAESLMQPVSGKASDRFNRRTICMVGFLLMPVALFLAPAARTFFYLAAVGLFLGSSSGISVPAAGAISVEKGRHYGMGAMMGLEAAAQALGMAAGATIGGTLMELFSISVAFRTAAAAALSGAIVFGFFTRGYVNGQQEPQLVTSYPGRPRLARAAAGADSSSGGGNGGSNGGNST